MAEDCMVCRECKGKVPRTHVGSSCPLCGKDTTFEVAIEQGDVLAPQLEERAVLQSTLERWIWSVPYVVVWIVATIGSVAFGLIPGWGTVAGVVCTLVSTATGFKAGMKYREVVRWSL